MSITEAADLQEDSPAYRAFWEATAKTPGLTDLSDVLKAQILPERFQELVDDLASIVEEGDEMDAVVRRAQILRDDLTGTDPPYWGNLVFQQLCLDVMVADMLGFAEEDEDDQEDA